MDGTAKDGTRPHHTQPSATPVLPRKRQLHLTERAVRDLPAVPGERYEVKDQKLPYLRIRISGTSKTWSVLRRRRGGKMIRAKLGDWPGMSCERARAAALRTAGELGEG